MGAKIGWLLRNNIYFDAGGMARTWSVPDCAVVAIKPPDGASHQAVFVGRQKEGAPLPPFDPLRCIVDFDNLAIFRRADAATLGICSHREAHVARVPAFLVALFVCRASAIQIILKDLFLHLGG